MFKHEVLPSERRCQRRLLPSSMLNFPDAFFLKAKIPKIPMIWVNPGSTSRQNRGMLTPMPCYRLMIFTPIYSKRVRAIMQTISVRSRLAPWP